MPASVNLRTDYSAEELRRLAKNAKTISQGRRLLSLAAVLDGMSRADAARIGGMDRQTLRDWVHRFNAAGPDGLLDNWSKGRAPRLSTAQKGRTGGDRRSRSRTGKSTASCAGGASIFKRVIKERFGVEYHERHVGTLSADGSASLTSARARAIPARTPRSSRLIKKLRANAEGASGRCPRKAFRWKSGFRTKRASARRTALSAMGETRLAASPASRSALRERLSLRRDLPGAR